MSDDKLTHKNFKEIEEYFLNDDFDEFKKKIIKLDKNRKSVLFSTMFYQVSLTKINCQKKYKNAFFNASRISYQLEEGKYEKRMSWTFINPTNRYIGLSYHILRQITDIDDFLLDFYENNTTVPLYVKCFLFSEIKKERKDNSHQKLNITDETQEKIFDILKNSLENVKLDDILDDSFDDFNLIFLYKEFDFSLESLSKELKVFMFNNNDENFFQVMEKIKYWQMSSDGNEYLINKDILKELNCLDETINYIDNLDRSKLLEKDKQLLDIWNKASK